MMTRRRHKINFLMHQKSGDLEIRRNDKKEITIKNPSTRLVDLLGQVLKVERDYERFLDFYSLDDNTHLGSWLINYLAHIERDEIIGEFRKVVVVPR